MYTSGRMVEEEEEEDFGGRGRGERLSPKELVRIYDSIFSVTGLPLMGI